MKKKKNKTKTENRYCGVMEMEMDKERDDTIVMIPRNLQEGIESMKQR